MFILLFARKNRNATLTPEVAWSWEYGAGGKERGAWSTQGTQSFFQLKTKTKRLISHRAHGGHRDFFS